MQVKFVHTSCMHRVKMSSTNRAVLYKDRILSLGSENSANNAMC